MTFDITQLTEFIGSFGFPIVMCGYMAIKFDKTLAENTRAIHSLTTVITHLLEKDGNHPGLDLLEKGDKD